MALANIVHQIIAAMILLIVPKILGVSSYAQVVFVTALISFNTFADFGLSFVYSRRMPGIYARQDADEIATWNSSILKIRFYTAFFFSAAIASIYLSKFEDIVNASLLFMILPTSVLVQIFTASNSSRELFSTTRDISLLQSLGRLTILPSITIVGIKGWMIGQLISAAVVFFRKDLRAFCSKHVTTKAGINWRLIVDNLPEAIRLGLITTLWMQLLYSGRMFASFIYPDFIISQYGLANTAYQVVASLIIAAFIPQTIRIYKLVEDDGAGATNYVLKIIVFALPVLVSVVVVGSLISPWFFDVVFPEYQLDSRLIIPLLACLVGYPVIVTIGTLLIGTNRHKSYLAVIMFWLLSSWVLASIGQSYFGYNSAAIAQLISLSMYAITLLCLVAYSFSEIIRNKWNVFISVAFICTTLISCLYLIL